MKNAALLILVFALFACSGSPRKPQSNNTDTTKTSEVKPVNEYTVDMYNKIEVGMNLADVKNILLKDGVLLTQASSTANQQGAGKISAKLYTWTNKDGSYIEITFVEGIVVTKNKVNLN
ncbi:MAG: hypothetical protein KBB11_00540 [Bacteroidales bacterium]|nr:hypothetical protein [Bacteroidales bacterium]HOY38079.1 hypothetical protein [Bacteroidales bacterium]HQN92675.1 hypothetical protein [Prolixibacteraceae bacterium]